VVANQHARVSPGPARVEGSGGGRQDPQKCFFEYASSLMAVFQGDVLQNGTLGVRGPFTHGVELTVELCSWFVNLEPPAIR
jgi:hypothetical protein